MKNLGRRHKPVLKQTDERSYLYRNAYLVEYSQPERQKGVWSSSYRVKFLKTGRVVAKIEVAASTARGAMKTLYGNAAYDAFCHYRKCPGRLRREIDRLAMAPSDRKPSTV